MQLRKESPAVEDCNMASGGRRGMTQPRIDTGFWTQKGKNAKEAIGGSGGGGGAGGSGGGAAGAAGGSGGARGVRFTGIHCTYKYTHISDYKY